ncbi:hypothetical protein KV557_00080 [Kitasatospora aureofaciens]|uniref:hypothetical protein n=1 Tax=Kitasatospora aureofaciens TaxID=1894 RepID=UPI001C474D4A|nr:hypothetical protein [Kitasatospora aureofaciens]MBV6695523.1 hypothetical protein [Kitasatospora aureofaciens]
MHGIWNRQRGMTPQEAAVGMASTNRRHLEAGLTATGLSHVALPEVVMAYYADLLDDAPVERQGGVEDSLLGLSNTELPDVWEWLVVAGVPEPEDVQAYLYAPVRQAFGWLVQQRVGAGIAAQVRQHGCQSLAVLTCPREINPRGGRPEKGSCRRRQRSYFRFRGRFGFRSTITV